MNLEVRIRGMDSAGRAMNSCGREVTQIYAEVAVLKKTCAFSGNVRRSMQSSYQALLKSLELEKRAVYSMEQTLDRIQKVYVQQENKIISAYSGQTVVSTVNKNGSSTEIIEESTKPFAWSWKDTWDIIKEVGIIGKATGGIAQFVTEKDSNKKLQKLLKTIVATVGDVGQLTEKGLTSSDAIKQLLGLQDFYENLDVDHLFSSYFKKEFIDDLGLNGAKTTVDKVKVSTKWAGHILSLVTNAFENYEEMKEPGGISFERAVSETVVETGVDILLNAGITAGVSVVLGGILTAVGAPVMVPAVVVGGLTVGVTWAANGVCKWLTDGKDIGEVVADAVCDFGETIDDIKMRCMDNVQNWLGTAWSGICGAFG